MTRAAADTETKLLDLAEDLIRKNGYNGFSFRDLASGVGVKSSTVHYYFPTKADLGAKVARRYTDRFVEGLGNPADAAENAETVIARLNSAFANALGNDGRMCLCGVLAAESAGLPPEVAAEARQFFDRTGDWLRDGLKQTDWGCDLSDEVLQKRSLAILAQLEGAMLIVRVMGQPARFDDLAPGVRAHSFG